VIMQQLGRPSDQGDPRPRAPDSCEPISGCDRVEPLWIVELQEQVVETVEILLWGERAADVIQASATGLQAAFTANARRLFDLGSVDVR